MTEKQFVIRGLKDMGVTARFPLFRKPKFRCANENELVEWLINKMGNITSSEWHEVMPRQNEVIGTRTTKPTLDKR